MKIRKGDTVKIISGKDRGKTGKVNLVLINENKIVVEGINVRKKHNRPKKQGQKGQIVQIAMPIHSSNAMVICMKCNKATKVFKKNTGARKLRICKKCGAEMN